MGVVGQHNGPAVLPPGKTQYLFYRRLGRPLYIAKCTFIENQGLLGSYKKYILCSTDSYRLLDSLQVCYLWVRQKKCTYNVTQTRSRNRCSSGKAISITYSECVSVALVIQHEQRVSRITWSSAVRLVLPHFSTSQKVTPFGKALLNFKCVLILFTSFIWNIAYSKTNSARYYRKRT